MPKNNILKQYLLGSKRQPIPFKKPDYPVVPPDAETLQYFKENPGTTGMAYGAGLNASDPKSPRVVTLNPYSGLTPNQQQYLIDNEKLRHFMDEKNYNPSFKPTPEQVSFFKGAEYGKPEHEKYLKQTLIARIITGDESAGNFTNEQAQEAAKIFQQYQKERESLSFAKPKLADTVMSALRMKKDTIKPYQSKSK